MLHKYIYLLFLLITTNNSTIFRDGRDKKHI